jgi:hypothetical protein
MAAQRLSFVGHCDLSDVPDAAGANLEPIQFRASRDLCSLLNLVLSGALFDGYPVHSLEAESSRSLKDCSVCCVLPQSVEHCCKPFQKLLILIADILTLPGVR